jgi:hypothetical protein
MTESVDVICTIDLDLASGKTMCRLAVDPMAALNGEHIIVNLRRSTVDLHRGKWYRVTFEEIDPPGTLPG